MKRKSENKAGRKPNAAWLRDRMESLGYSQRSLGLAVDIDHTNISRMLKGEIDVPASRVCVLAKALGLSPDELLRMLGYEVEDGERVRVVGVVKADGTIGKAPAGKYVPPAPGTDAIGALVFDADTKMAGALAYLGRSVSAETATGALCLVDEDGPARLRLVARPTSRRIGTVNLEAAPGLAVAGVEEDAKVQTVQKVTWLKP